MLLLPTIPLRIQDLPPKSARFVLSFIKKSQEYCILKKKSLIVACSGGVDSAALLLLFRYAMPLLQCSIKVVHIDHLLREESTAEAKSVKEMARRLGLCCEIYSENISEYAKKELCGIEEAGRKYRYLVLEKERKKYNAIVCTGHHLNDLAEDVFMRLIRGVSIDNMFGMSFFDEKRKLVRPLLYTRKKDLIEFLQSLSISWIEDASNKDRTFFRNRVRHNIVPFCEEENPSFLENIISLHKQSEVDKRYWFKELENYSNDILLKKDLLKLPKAGRLRLYKRVLEQQNIHPTTKNILTIERMFEAKTKQCFAISKNVKIVVDKDYMHFKGEEIVMNILFFGPNGSGKGTQALFLEKELSLEHIETGAIFRKHISENTELGKKAKEYIEKGMLVPDSITVPMIISAIKASKKKGWLLDGFPRNDTQAKALDTMLHDEKIQVNVVIEIKLDRFIAKERIMGRRTCVKDPSHANNLNIGSIAPDDEKECRICGAELKTRPDDIDEKAINKRHEIYYDENSGTVAAMEFYKNKAKSDTSIKYIVVDGSKQIEEVNKELLKKLEKK